jgi:hypothetical protein
MKRYLNSAFALGLLLVSTIALADRDDNRRGNGRGPPDFVGHSDSRGDGRGDNRNDDRSDYREYRNDGRDNDDDVNWSVNLNIGARPFGYNPFGYNMLGYRPEPYSYRTRQPTVIYQTNTYIREAPTNGYVVRPAPTTAYTVHNTGRPGVSLLRDRSGRCFERVTDNYGNETRTELRSSECNF